MGYYSLGWRHLLFLCPSHENCRLFVTPRGRFLLHLEKVSDTGEGTAIDMEEYDCICQSDWSGSNASKGVL